MTDYVYPEYTTMVDTDGTVLIKIGGLWLEANNRRARGYADDQTLLSRRPYVFQVHDGGAVWRPEPAGWRLHRPERRWWLTLDPETGYEVVDDEGRWKCTEASDHLRYAQAVAPSTYKNRFDDS
jgi:hypothetical protein